MALRVPAEGRTLNFDENGTMQGGDLDCSWTLCSNFVAQSVSVKQDHVEIGGFRCSVLFTGDPLRPLYLQTTRPLTLRIQFLDAPRLTSALEQVLLRKDEALSEFVPAYWKSAVRAYIEGKLVGAGKLIDPAPGDDPYFWVVGNRVKAPQLIDSPDPSYTDAAKQARVAGSVTISMVVQANGEPGRLTITKPLGMGLDEQALKAVQKWRFKPATMEGKAVPVYSKVDVIFHLY